MNKILAILFLLGALGSFGLSQRDSFQFQSQTRTGAPVGEVRIHYVTRAEKWGYIVFGLICAVGGLYFISRIQRDR
jgi:hypothetical protein